MAGIGIQTYHGWYVWNTKISAFKGLTAGTASPHVGFFVFFLNLDCFYFYHVCITIYLTSIVNFTGLSDYHGFHVGIEVRFEHWFCVGDEFPGFWPVELKL